MEQSVLLWRIASRELPFTLEPSEQNPDQFSATQHTFFVLLASAFARYTALNHNGVPSRNALGLSIDSRGGHSGIGSVQAAAIAVGVSLGTTWASTSGIASSINRHSLIQFGHPGYAESNPTYLARTIAALLAIKSDCKLIEEKGWKTLAKGPLWLQDDICPPFWSERQNLLRKILPAEQHGHVWQRLYDRILFGRSASKNEERLYVDEALNELLDKHEGFKLVTDWIAARLEEMEASQPPPELPSQGPGTHMVATADGKIGHAPAEELDSDGNNVKRINQLRPLALQCAQDLKERLAANQFPELLDSTENYIAALTGDNNRVDWATVWGLGLMLEQNAKAAERKITDRLFPELEDPAKAALDSLLKLHGPLMLSTKDGNDLFEDEKRYRVPPDQLKEMYKAVEEIVHRLRDAPEILMDDTRATFNGMASATLDNSRPERTAGYVAGTTKNALIVLVAGGIAASPTVVTMMVYGSGAAAAAAAFSAGHALLVYEAIKKSKPFAALQATLTRRIDTLADMNLRDWLNDQAILYAPFRRVVIENEKELLTMAERENLGWLRDYVRLIVKHKDSVSDQE
jgi:hypothetical protein